MGSAAADMPRVRVMCSLNISMTLFVASAVVILSPQRNF